MQAPKNGFFYVLDRVTGELLSADKFAPVTWASHVDLKTGRPVETEVANYSREMQLIVPAPLGAHNWHPMAFNPKTGPRLHPGDAADVPVLAVGRLQEHRQVRSAATCSGTRASTGTRRSTRPMALMQQFGGVLPPDRGYLKAWDPVQKKTVWEIEHPAFWNGGLLTTARQPAVPGHRRRPLRRLRGRHRPDPVGAADVGRHHRAAGDLRGRRRAVRRR